MNASIRDLIDEKLKDFEWNSEDEPSKIKLDTYSYAMLMEELGHDPEVPFREYRGLKIKVDSEIDELCEIV